MLPKNENARLSGEDDVTQDKEDELTNRDLMVDQKPGRMRLFERSLSEEELTKLLPNKSPSVRPGANTKRLSTEPPPHRSPFGSVSDQEFALAENALDSLEMKTDNSKNLSDFSEDDSRDSDNMQTLVADATLLTTGQRRAAAMPASESTLFTTGQRQAFSPDPQVQPLVRPRGAVNAPFARTEALAQQHHLPAPPMSDGRIDPSPAAITVGTRAVQARSPWGWVSAFGAVAVLGGFAVFAAQKGYLPKEALSALVDPSAKKAAAAQPVTDSVNQPAKVDEAPVTNPVATTPADPVQAKAEPVKTEPAKADTTKVEAAKADSNPVTHETPKAVEKTPPRPAAVYHPPAPKPVVEKAPDPPKPVAAAPAQVAPKEPKPAKGGRKDPASGNASDEDKAAAERAKALADKQLQQSL